MRPLQNPWPYVIFISIIFLVVREAWFCDDSFFTIRSSLNLRHGLGPVWNPGERVQSFTNPLWMLLLSAVPTGWIFGWTIFLSAFLIAGTLVLLISIGKNSYFILSLILLILGSSWVFIDFGTSGLETPLSAFLVALSSTLSIKQRVSGRSPVGWIGIVGGFSFLSRPDLVLINLLDPVIRIALATQIAIKTRLRGLCMMLGSAFLVIFSWMAFSAIYYGFPFPVTAYAKLGQSLDRLDILKHGVGYLLTFLLSDLPGAMLIALAFCSPVFINISNFPTSFRKGVSIVWVEALRPPAIILITFFYTIWIGGDFMIGRFYFPLIVYSAFTLASLGPQLETLTLRMGIRKKIVLSVLLFILASPFLNGRSLGIFPLSIGGKPPNYLLTPFYRSMDASGANAWCFSGACDERSTYMEVFSFFGAGNVLDRTSSALVVIYQVDANFSKRQNGLAAGHSGLLEGPNSMFWDDQGLTDQFQARMPVIHRTAWRPAHFTKFFPRDRGLPKLLASDPDLSNAFETLELITRGPIFTINRWRQILLYNFGGHNQLYRRIADRYGEPTVENCLLSNRPNLCLSEIRSKPKD
jgi:arabinofuranosyltransferase